MISIVLILIIGVTIAHSEIVSDNCTCPTPSVTLDRNTSSFLFEITPNCFRLVCRSTITLAENLRDSYRLKVDNDVVDGDSPITYSLIEGTSVLWLDPYDIIKGFVSVRPQIVLSLEKDTHVIFNLTSNGHSGSVASWAEAPSRFLHFRLEVELVETSKEVQARCTCPQFGADNSFEMIVDKSCPPFDCMWNFPTDFHSQDMTFISLSTNNTNQFDDHELKLFRQHDVVKSRLRVADYQKLFPADPTERVPTILWYHRADPVALPGFYEQFPYLKPEKLTIHRKVWMTAHYTPRTYEGSCGCFNKTILLNSTSEIIFTSPGYSRPYCSNLHCRTVFEAPQGYRVVFKPNNISLEPNHDFLYLFDLKKENLRRTGSLLMKYSGSYNEGAATESIGPNLLAVFLSDRTVNYDGFTASVSTVAEGSSDQLVSGEDEGTKTID